VGLLYSPKVGEVLECKFGNFKRLEVEVAEGEDPPAKEDRPIDETNFDGRIPPEMVKKRMVLVLNGKLNGGCLVVPISSTMNQNGINRGYHVSLGPDLFRTTEKYDNRDRWAKSDMIQVVSKERLFKLKDGDYRFNQYLPREVVEKVQRAVVKTMSAAPLLAPPKTKEDKT